MIKKTALTILFFLLGLSSQAQTIEGYAYVDKNNNGSYDDGEGLSGILISNQKTIVPTDRNGKYLIENNPDGTVFAIKPADYDLSSFYLEDLSQPNFQLTPKKTKLQFRILAIGDIQVQSEASIDAFRHDIIEELLDYQPEFSIFMGDLADNDLKVYPALKDLLDELPHPYYTVFGNHDIDFTATTESEATKSYRPFWGPDYYSFNEGKVHFITLNNVKYTGYRQKDNKQDAYFGGFDKTQLEWLEKDMKQVKKDQLIVLNVHIPFTKDYSDQADVEALFKILKGHDKILLLNGHTHTIENYFLKPNGFQGEQLQNLTIGAACGSWWCGPLDERGIPVSTCTDGSPNGYYVIDFDGNEYDYRFIPSDHDRNFQMRAYKRSCSDEIYVNIFTATSKAKVIMEVEDQTIEMENITAHDPFFSDTYQQRWNYDNWHPSIEYTSHLWKAKLPETDKENITLHIMATDQDGHTYQDNFIFKNDITMNDYTSGQTKYIDPTDGNATIETKALYTNLLKISGKKTMFGHQDAGVYGMNWKYENDRSDIKDVCGSHPAVFGWELGHIELGNEESLDNVRFSKIREGIINAYNQGAVNTVSWHLRNPVNGETAWDVTPGTIHQILNDPATNAKFRSWLDILCDFFASLKTDDGTAVPIIFRPFHEHTESWFWWGDDLCTIDDYKELWHRTITYIRDTKNIHNVLYAYSPDNVESIEKYMEKYPGDEWIDILGLDVYHKGTSKEKTETFIHDIERILSETKEQSIRRNKVFALTETGLAGLTIPDWWTNVIHEAIKTTHPAWLLVWRNTPDRPNEYYAPYLGGNSCDDFRKFKALDDMIFLDNIPEFYK